MRIVDITGPIYSGMWRYPDPYPEVKIEEIPVPEWVEYPTYSWSFQLGAQSGTYLETSRHMDCEGPALIEIPASKLFMRPASVIRVDVKPLQPIARSQIVEAAAEIHPGDAIILCTGWGSKWRDPDFIESCPHLSREAMDWLLDREPFLIAADLPRFDSWEDPQLFFERFFDEGVLLLAPLCHCAEIQAGRGHLVALPMKVEETCAAPCRTLFIEGWDGES